VELFPVKGVEYNRSDLEALEDRQLIEVCQKGDKVAFEILVQRHQQHAFNIAYGVLRNYEDACEVAQDTFVRVHHALERFRGDAEFTTWMYRIVLNLARNYLRYGRRHGHGRSVSLDEPIEGADGLVQRELPSASDAPDATVVKDEFARLVLNNIRRLPRTHREVLVLRNVEHLSYEEIAKVLGCSMGTVKSRIARAREELRRRMGSELQ
jgi:RNA polymerase sigma-70 factor (ECF subfamily)